MESLFKNMYSYRERKDKGNLENYLIEIFSYVLKYDPDFRVAFMSEIGVIDLSGFDVKTQSSYSVLGRPDVEINCNDHFILIECKVDASEGQDQLKRYCDILNLNSKSKKKTLVYLTKYYENKEIDKDLNIDFKSIRWYDIFQLINKQTKNQLKEQLIIFLTDMKIAMNNSIKDLSDLQTLPGTIATMDEAIDNALKAFNHKLIKGTVSRFKRLEVGNYYQIMHFDEKRNYNLDIGFFGIDSEKPKMGVRIYISNKRKENFNIVHFDSLSDNWNKTKSITGFYFEYLVDLSHMINNNEGGVLNLNKQLIEIINDYDKTINI
ncbi:PD-(D/E)XK nuclease family protein (plasmid) [Flammeovirga sp. MY04]|uniref:PD-(D/E)XK nuclease family protein n=1 Tax=Flammeovirga sp. MY04 TaxID=1191459 RepID=UPI00080628ED|nr:PD-(D/E)XK nuclease family protein [Flammeovirga sp. MY04]ANQ52909.1 PD-(D/E)XK nuclease family protein [Flammeovirga sp. MY04]